MATGKITIDQTYCKGCGYCEIFCPKDCIRMTKTLGSGGYPAPDFTDPDGCTGCGICGFMCPDFAIIVERHLKSAC